MANREAEVALERCVLLFICWVIPWLIGAATVFLGAPPILTAVSALVLFWLGGFCAGRLW